MPPLPISNEPLEWHVANTLRDIFDLLDQASNYKTRAKTVYYKCAFILMASAIEALVYHFIECHHQIDPLITRNADSTRLKGLMEINQAVTGSSKRLWLAEKSDVAATLNDITKDFNTMNDFARKYLGISQKLFENLDYVRRKRNEIHLQGLNRMARSFNRLQINRAGDTLLEVLTELDKINAI